MQLELTALSVTTHLSLSEELGVEAGAELQAAARAADAIGAHVLLGDVPLRVTAEHVWAGIQWWHAAALIGLLWTVFVSSFSSRVSGWGP